MPAKGESFCEQRQHDGACFLPDIIVRRKGTRKPFRREQCSKKDRQIRRKCELIVSQEIEHAAENMRELNPRKNRSPELTDQLVQILDRKSTRLNSSH